MAMSVPATESLPPVAPLPSAAAKERVAYKTKTGRVISAEEFDAAVRRLTTRKLAGLPKGIGADGLPEFLTKRVHVAELDQESLQASVTRLSLPAVKRQQPPPLKPLWMKPAVVSSKYTETLVPWKRAQAGSHDAYLRELHDKAAVSQYERTKRAYDKYLKPLAGHSARSAYDEVERYGKQLLRFYGPPGASKAAVISAS